MRPEARNGLRGKMGSINVDNYAGDVTFIHCDSAEKHIPAGGLRYYLVALNIPS